MSTTPWTQAVTLHPDVASGSTAVSLYAIDLGNKWPTTRGFADYDESTKPTAPYTLPGVKPVNGSKIRMLGSSKNLPWHQEGENLIIKELPEPLPCDHAWSFKIKIQE